MNRTILSISAEFVGLITVMLSLQYHNKKKVMVNSINFQSFIDSESLYFSKYGKGGVLICADNEQTYSLAKDFNSKQDLDSFLDDSVKKVISIQVNDESITVVLELSAPYVVKRIMPKNEVTVEVYEMHL
ncbi:hypothetical protein [Vibrio toranzoniae]|uniref:hypothetical protein n=2 Tax=Vibrio toranzoniae TaxID=1194427 RepID=UPI001378CF03|nr:hypothetical protein [Vibrio toranzoniae]NAZ92795.1 hypothetical protein [Vibrio toranzoniae]